MFWHGRKMQLKEQQLIKIVAKVSLWVAPVPSAFFVARASAKHLGATKPFDIIIAIVIETLGIATAHTALWLYSWNQESTTAAGNPRQGRTLASKLEIALAILTSFVYLGTVISLISVLERQFVYTLFPFLTMTSAVCLSLIARQESRERLLAEHKESKRKPKEEPSKPIRILHSENNKRGALKEARKEVLLTLLQSNPEMNPTDAAKAIGVSRPTVYIYLRELKESRSIENREAQGDR